MKRRKFIQKTTRGGTFTLLSVTGILGSATQNLKSQTDSVRRFNTGDKSWQDLTGFEDALKAYPQRIEGLMIDLDPGRPELSGVHRAWNKGDTAVACKALLAHYRDTGQVDWLRDPRGHIPWLRGQGKSATAARWSCGLDAQGAEQRPSVCKPDQPACPPGYIDAGLSDFRKEGVFAAD